MKKSDVSMKRRLSSHEIQKGASFVFGPELVTVLAMAASIGVLLLVHSLFGKRTGMIYHFFLGSDYRDFYEASRHLLISSPYDVGRYVTPPLPAMLNVPLTFLPFRTCVFLLLMFIPLCIAVSWLLLGRNLTEDRVSRNQIWVLLAVATLLSSPFYFLMNRLNIDGVVLLMMVVVVTMAEARPWISGAVLALAVCFKAYPVLLLLPFLVYRNRRALAGFGVAMVGFLLVTPGLWIQFLSTRIWNRVDQFQMTENASLHVLTKMLDRGFFRGGFRFSMQFENVLAYAIFLAGLVLVTRHLLRATPGKRPPFVVAALLYFPFMVAVPKLVYQYSLIIMLSWVPLVHWLKKRGVSNGSVCLAVVGVVLTQFPAIGWQRILSSDYTNVLPALGLAFLIDASVRVAKGLAQSGHAVQGVADADLA